MPLHPQEPEPINWAAWRKEVDPQLVDTFQKAYDSEHLSLPFEIYILEHPAAEVTGQGLAVLSNIFLRKSTIRDGHCLIALQAGNYRSTKAGGGAEDICPVLQWTSCLYIDNLLFLSCRHTAAGVPGQRPGGGAEACFR